MEEIARGSHRFEAELYASGIFYNKVRFFDAFQEISRNTAAVSGVIHFEKSPSSSQNLYIRCTQLLF